MPDWEDAMAIFFPEPRWPSELLEEGPEEDRSVLLRGAAEIAGARHRILAVRVGRSTLEVDVRDDLDESIYDDYRLQDMLDELGFFENVDQSVLVHLETGHYVIWMVPWGSELRG
jgi:hypothetical protein